MIMEILTYPNPILHEVSDEVTEFDEELKELAKNMFETMYDAPGVGLAAIQVGVKKRILVMDIDFKFEEDEEGNQTITGKNPRIFINPKITKHEGEIVYEEGCLSVPGVYESVKRYEKIEVEYNDLDGNLHTLVTGYEEDDEDLLAVCIQHEMDHLDGKLFIEKLSPLKRKFAIKQLKKEAELV
jgi:peptide deformylase